MKKLFLRLAICMFCLLFVISSVATGDSGKKSISDAAKSVLKIAVYEKNSDIEPFATGSGFIAINKATLITNYHVIEDAAVIIGFDNDENAYYIDKVICADKKADIAILELSKPSTVEPLELYPDDHLELGSHVYAIGCPKGLNISVSDGVVSSQFVEDGFPWIQITAPISPGSSGGALLNDKGKVIGVTTASYKSKDEYGENTDAQNLNFAVNIAVAQAMYNAWNGESFSIGKHKETARMDFTGVYDHKTTEVNNVESSTDHLYESWVCSNCGKENTSKFCLECGAEKPYWICSCGQINSSNKFCGECGRSLSELVDLLNSAITKTAENDYSGAIVFLKELGQFNNGSFESIQGKYIEAQQYIKRAYYNQAIYLQSNSGSHEEIIDAFQNAGDFADSKEQIEGENARYLKSFYDAGIEQLNNNEYDAAIVSFQKADNYLDATDQIMASYYAKGKDLLKAYQYDAARQAFSVAGEYKDAKEMISETYYLEGNEQLENGELAIAKECFVKAGEYKDSKEKIDQIIDNEKKQTYDSALSAYESGNYEQAINLFSEVSGYLDADEKVIVANVGYIQQQFSDVNACLEIMKKEDKEKLDGLLEALFQYKGNDEADRLYNQISYTIAKHLHANKEYYQAIEYYEKADGFSDAKELSKQCELEIINNLINGNRIEEAHRRIQSNPELLEHKNDFVIVKPGDNGDKVEKVLSLIKPLGIKTNGNIDIEEYKEEYIPYVKAIEEHFGMIADGRVSIDEFNEFNDAIYLGIKSDRAATLLEKLADLTYISKLPEDHSVYSNSFVNYIKKAETDLGLFSDGIITQSEYSEIINLHIDELESIKDLKASVKNDTVTLTWSKVPGAISYEIKRQGVILGTTKKTTWVDKNIETDRSYIYEVSAKKYTTNKFSSVSISVPKYYVPISVRTLRADAKNYVGKYIELKGLKPITWWIYDQHGKSVWASTTSPETSGWTMSKNKAITEAQTKNGYAILITCYTGVNGECVDLYIENYKSRGWDNRYNDLLGSMDKITNISTQGDVLYIKEYDFTPQFFPVITVDNIEWRSK